MLHDHNCVPCIPEYAGFYFTENLVYSPEILSEFNEEACGRLKILVDRYSATDDFSAANLEMILKGLAKELGIKVGPLVHPLRLAVTAAKSGPSLYHLMEVLGKDRTLKRIKAAMDFKV